MEEKIETKDKKVLIVVVILAIILVVLTYIFLFVIDSDNTNNEINKLCNEEKSGIVKEDSDIDKEKYKHEVNYARIDADDFSDFSYDKNSDNIEEAVEKEYIIHGQKLNDTCRDSKYVAYNQKLKDILNLKYVDLCGMDTRIIDLFIEKAEEYTQVFPELKKGFFDSIVVKDIRENTYAIFENIEIEKNEDYEIYGARLAFDLKMLSDYDTFKSNYEYQIKSGFNIKNSSMGNLLTHELSHALAFYLNKKENDINNNMVSSSDNWKKVRSTDIEKYICEKAIDSLRKNGNNKSIEELKKEISGYANLKKGDLDIEWYAETFAEAITDYIVNKENSADLSKNVFYETKKLLESY